VCDACKRKNEKTEFHIAADDFIGDIFGLRRAIKARSRVDEDEEDCGEGAEAFTRFRACC
jgi:hypothetical protein